jgi:hypothetical protein
MQLIDLKAQEEKIDDIRFVIASVAKRSIHMVLDCRSRIQSFAMTSFSDCRVVSPLAMTWMWCI